MPDADAGAREQLLDEILAAYLNARQQGQAPDRRELLGRHPDLAAELAEFFADLDGVDRLVAPLREAVAPKPGLNSGTAVGNYEILEEVARGGMGVIFKARQKDLRRIVALKMLLAGPWAGSGERHRFRAEAEAVANLDHPHIVPILEVGEWGEKGASPVPYFTMKWMEGGSLATGVRGQGPGVSNEEQKKAARVVGKVARAVHYAHLHGVLHRDLKPANILLDAQGEPHVSDFGLAKRVAAWDPGRTGPWVEGEAPARTGATPPPSGLQTQTGTVLGTPSYMAPEQATGQKGVVTTAADVYGLGAILYELLTGRPPFRAATPLQTLHDLMEREPERPRAADPGIDRDLETICLKCLDKDPHGRYPSAQALADDLERFLTGEPIQARPVSRLGRAWRWCRRQPALAASLTLASLGLVALAAGSLVFAVRESRHADQLGQANADLSRQQAETAAALTEADRQRVRAEEHFRQAHQVVSDFCLRLNEELEKAPGLQPFRKKLLETSLQYYQNFLAQRGGDPALRTELADTYFAVGRLSSSIGAKAKAREAYGEALRLYQKLLDERPKDLALQRQIASTRHNLGVAADSASEALQAFQEALALYEQFLTDHPDDLVLQRRRANTYNSLGFARRRNGQMAEAIAAFRQARDSLRPLAARQPKSAAVQFELSLFVNNVGAFQSEVGDLAEALQSFQEARAIRQKLVDAHPGDSSYELALAASIRDIGRLQRNTGRMDEGRESLRQAVTMQERLARVNPSVARIQSDLAGGYRELGLAEIDRGRRADALELFRKAAAVLERLTRDHPGGDEYPGELARCYFQVGYTFGTRQPDAAARAYRQAQEVLEPLTHRHPENPDWQSLLGDTLNGLGLVLNKQGKPEEALATVRRGIEYGRRAFERAPRMNRFRTVLVRQYATLAQLERAAGHAAEVVKAAQERQKVWPGDPMNLYGAAQDLARAAALVGKGRTDLTADERAERDRYAGLAVAALRQAFTAGFADRNRLRKDAAFEAVRGRDDFRRLADGS